MKTLTIIVPSFNMEQYLSKCLDSLVVRDELRPYLEVLIVNDGSTDKTGEIASLYEQKYPLIFRTITKSNGHYGSCINSGLSHANGVFVKVLDADDFFETASLECLIQELQILDEQHLSIDVVFTGFGSVNESGQKGWLYRPPFKGGALVSIKDIASLGSAIPMHIVTYRRDLLLRLKYHQTEGISYTDNEWCFLPLAKIRAGFYLPVQLYWYLIGREGQSISATAARNSYGMYEKVFDSLIETYKTHRESITSDSKLYLENCMISLAKTMVENLITLQPINHCRQCYEQLLFSISSCSQTAKVRFESVFVNVPFQVKAKNVVAMGSLGIIGSRLFLRTYKFLRKHIHKV